MKQLIERFDNAINPIVVKELRQAVNGRFVSALLMLFLLVSVIFLIAAVADMNTDLSSVAGRDVMLMLNGVLLFTCMVVLPIFTAVRMANERADTQVDLMYITTLPARAIVWGKLTAAMIVALLVFSACMPFMTLSYLLRGIDLPTIFFILTLGFAVVILATMLAIFAACVSTGRGFRLLVGLALLWGLGMGCVLTNVLSVEVVNDGLAGTFDGLDAWLGALVFVLVIAMGVWLLYTWSVALITAPGANRMRPVRLTMMAAWAIMSIAVWIWGIYLDAADVIRIWAAMSAIYFSIGMLIAVGEREEWGQRVAETIPRSFFGRIIAFLTYSGSAGGMLWSWLMIVLVGAIVCVAAPLWDQWFGTTIGRVSPMDSFGDAELLQQVVGLGLYVYAYCISALLIRRHVLRHVVPPSHTWSLALVLGALGCTLPLLVTIFMTGGDWYQDEEVWLIANPAALFQNDRSLLQSSLLFTAVWSIVVTVLWAPSFMAQWRRFVPPAATEADNG